MFMYDKIMLLAIVIGNLSAHCTDDKRSNKYNEKYTSATAVRLFEMLPCPRKHARERNFAAGQQ